MASTDSAVSTEGHPLVGAWLLVEADDPDRPPSLVAFTSDGIYQQADFDGTASYGSWEATGPSSAAMTFIQQFPGDDGEFGGSTMIRASIEVNPDGQSFTADYTIEMGGDEGAPAGEYGPGAVSATRIAVEPMGTPAVRWRNSSAPSMKVPAQCRRPPADTTGVGNTHSDRSIESRDSRSRPDSAERNDL